MIDIDGLTRDDFAKLPLVIEGESKEVRYAGDGLAVIRFKPTVYSHTHNRCGVIEGSDVLRLRATRRFLPVLKEAGIRHAYRQVSDRWVLADLVMPHPVEFAKYKLPPFVPGDLSPERLRTLPKAPPIEVIVKRYHGGTSKHRYKGMCGAPVRSSHKLYAGMAIEAEGAYPMPLIRFDWRNPIKDDKGDRVPDEILPESLAHLFIDTERAEHTALRLHSALEEFLGWRDIVCNDLCLFVAEDGETVYGEISQDCGRFRHFDLGSLDKDVWRTGGSHAQVLEKWQLLLDLIEKED
jgi:phosphoribosylaminoimidazole-succinocarboxamide synthase